MSGDARLYAPSAARNREPIFATLKPHLPARGLVLEVASGTGEHVVHLAQGCPDLAFQPSDPDAAHRASIDAWRAALGLANVRPAIVLDVRAEVWPVQAADGPYYRAELAAPVSATKPVVSGTVFNCAGTNCAGGKATSRPAIVCARLAKEVGEVATFTANGKTLATEELAKCNSK